MKILAIDTSALVASCAILDEDKIIAEYSLNFQMTHSQTIMPMISEIFIRTGLDIKDMDYIAVSEGPGSFTGLRIGAATAKGLALGHNIPLVPVPTLKAMAYNVFSTKEYICPIMDARREQVYAGIFCRQEECLVEVMQEQAIGIEELIEKALQLGGNVIFLGDGVLVHKDKLYEYLEFSTALSNCNYQRASSVGVLAINLIKEGKYIDGKNFKPVYLRKPQAERELEERAEIKDK